MFFHLGFLHCSRGSNIISFVALRQRSAAVAGMLEFVCANCLQQKVQHTMIIYQYTFYPSHFRILYGLRPQHNQGLPAIVSTMRHVAEFCLEVLAVGKRMLDELIVIEACPIPANIESGPWIGSRRTIFKSS